MVQEKIVTFGELVLGLVINGLDLYNLKMKAKRPLRSVFGVVVSDTDNQPYIDKTDDPKQCTVYIVKVSCADVAYQ